MTILRGSFASLIAITLLLSPVVRAENSEEKHAGVREEQARISVADLETLTRKAFNGNPKAQFALGLIYEEGRGGIKKDLAYALSWYEEAAHNGIKAAMLKLNGHAPALTQKK